MGYYTSYFLRATGYTDELTEEEANNLCDVIELVVPVKAFGGEICSTDWKGVWSVEADLEAKWYDFDRDMTALSLNYPGVLFDLEGKGEDQDDIWRFYYLGGKCQKDGVVISYNQFSPDKLKPNGYFEGVPSLAGYNS